MSSDRASRKPSTCSIAGPCGACTTAWPPSRAHTESTALRASSRVARQAASSATDGRQCAGRGRADALPDDHRAALLEAQRAGGQRHQRRCRGRARALHDDGHQHAHTGQDPARGRPAAGKGVELPLHALHAFLQGMDAGEQQPEAGQDGAERAPLALGHHPQQGTGAQQRQRVVGDADAKAEDRHHPRRRRRAQRGADGDAHRLREAHQPGADEADHGHDRRRRGLDRDGEQRAAGDRAAAPGHQRLQRAAHRVAGQALQALGQVVDAQQEQADAAQQFDEGGVVRSVTPGAAVRPAPPPVPPSARHRLRGSAGPGSPPPRRPRRRRRGG